MSLVTDLVNLHSPWFARLLCLLSAQRIISVLSLFILWSGPRPPLHKFWSQHRLGLRRLLEDGACPGSFQSHIYTVDVYRCPVYIKVRPHPSSGLAIWRWSSLNSASPPLENEGNTKRTPWSWISGTTKFKGTLGASWYGDGGGVGLLLLHLRAARSPYLILSVTFNRNRSCQPHLSGALSLPTDPRLWYHITGEKTSTCLLANVLVITDGLQSIPFSTAPL